MFGSVIYGPSPHFFSVSLSGIPDGGRGERTRIGAAAAAFLCFPFFFFFRDGATPAILGAPRVTSQHRYTIEIHVERETGV